MGPRSFTFFGRSSSLLLAIFYHLLLAVTEMLAGSLCLLIAFFAEHPSITTTIAQIASKSRLDQFITWFMDWLVRLQLDYQLMLNIGLILMGLGIFKIIVAFGLWFKSHKMRTAAMFIFGAISLYGIYDLIVHFSVFNIISVLLDLSVVYYFWKILPKHIND